MKKFFVIFASLLICYSYLQTVPVINAEVISPLQYSNQEVQEWERYLKIYYTSIENENVKLSASDKKFKDMFETRHKKPEDDYFEPEMTPWAIEEPGCSWYCGANYNTRVSSSLASQGTNIYSKESIEDNDTRTAWVEGVPGYGIGEFIEFIFPFYSARATTAFIANGYNKNETTWRNNSRVKTFNIYDEDRLIGIVHLKDTRDLQSFKLPYAFPNRPDNFTDSSYHEVWDDENQIILNPIRLKFVITDVYRGDKYEDTAISEFLFDGLDVHCLAKGTLIKMADKSEKNIEDVRIGEFVLSYNTEKDLFEPKAITKTHQATHNNLLKINLLNIENNTTREIITTNDHPFLSDLGWVSYDPEKTKKYKRYTSSEVTKYGIGKHLSVYTENGKSSLLITHIKPVYTSMETYTLELEGDGTFIANELLAGQE